MGRNAKSAAQSSAPSPIVTTPIPIKSDLPLNTDTDVKDGGLKVTAGMVVPESTPKKHKAKAVSFADPPTGANNETLPFVASSLAVLASGSTEDETESAQKVSAASSLSLVITESSKSKEIAPLATAHVHDDETLILPHGSEKSDQVEALSFLSSLQDKLSLTSDTSSLTERSTRGRKRGRGRRGRGRRTLNTKETKGVDNEGEVVTVRSRGSCWRRGRGGRKTPEFTGSASVETVEQSVTAAGGRTIPTFHVHVQYTCIPVFPKARLRVYWDSGTWVEPDTTSKILGLSHFHIKKTVLNE